MQSELVQRVLVTVLSLAAAAPLVAQQGRGAGGGQAQPPPSPQAAAPVDLTGYWVSIVTEDWRWRMVTPPKGDYASLENLMTPAARKVADAWDPSEDGSCLAYGAAGLMRMPTRLHITWDGEHTLLIETDAGQQTRRLLFDRSVAPGSRSLQGLSIAEWQPFPARRGGGPGGGDGAAAGGRGGPAEAPRGGSLKIVTTNLSGGWLRRNGVPYSTETTMTEYVDRFSPGDEWLVVTTIVSDPQYLTQDFITSTHFRREADGATKWDPTPCTEAGPR
jgi:hypothetical protein